METRDFDLMSTDELWSLHQELATRLAARLTSEKAMLESRLKQLNQQWTSERQAGLMVLKRERRPYPPVVPKYQNPAKTSETWSGRGKQPRWLVDLLKTGKQIDDFRIPTRPLRASSDVNRFGKA